MTLTREQIEEWRKYLGSFYWSAEQLREMNALCDLALAAWDMRERAAKKADDRWHYWDDLYRFPTSTFRGSPYAEGARDACEFIAAAIRALPIPSDQQASRAERVPAQAQRAAPSPVQHPEPAPAREHLRASTRCSASRTGRHY